MYITVLAVKNTLLLAFCYGLESGLKAVITLSSAIVTSRFSASCFPTFVHLTF